MKVSEGEKKCRKVIENIFGFPFKSERPSFLINQETGHLLELDCYNERLKIAVEYNGVQHYEWPNFTNQSKKKFNKQKYRDRLKKRLCRENDIYLIIVSYKIDNIKKYIKKKLISYLVDFYISKM